jgi:PKD repeat protein
MFLHSPVRDTTAWFKWTFPNSIESYQQDPVIPNVDITYSGWVNHEIRTSLDTVSFGYLNEIVPVLLADFTYQVLPYLCDSFINYCQNFDHVHWDFGDNYSSNLVSPVHCYTTPGNYSVTVTAYGACDTTTKTIIINSAVAIPEHSLAAISIAPNPATTTLNITGLTIAATAEVYDISGKQLLSQPLNTQAIDISNLAPGLYFIRISTAEGSVVKKFVKE